MKNRKKLRDETILLHGGHMPDKDVCSRAVPIYQTTSFLFENSDDAASLFALEKEGNIYTRIMNPTTSVLEERMASFEGGTSALAVASGQAAISVALLAVASCGDEIVASSKLYGGTYTLFRYTFEKFGIKVRFVDISNIEDVEAAITDKTKALYVESISNPSLDIADIEALSAVAGKNSIPLVVDNTVSPYILKPKEFGANVVVYSATKYIGGHGTSIGGIIVDCGNFDWGNGKFPAISDDDKSYHGINFCKKFGDKAYIAKCRLLLLRDLGPAISPFNSFLILQGLETLHLRMPRHCENAEEAAKFLAGEKNVSWVNFPAFSSEKKEMVEKYLKGYGGAIVGFGIKGGKEGGKKFIDSLELISHLANIGDAKTLAIHPASTTHSQLSEEELALSGVSEDYIRLSVGIENIEDIKEDLRRAICSAIF